MKLTLVELAKIEDMAILGEDGNPVGYCQTKSSKSTSGFWTLPRCFANTWASMPKRIWTFTRTVWINVSEALEPTKSFEESNGPDGILSEASKKFQEAAAMATFNWGNAHVLGEKNGRWERTTG